MNVLLANPRGFCAGVDRAIEIVKRAIDSLGAPIYVRHEVVHNRFVVEDLRQRGAVFVEELDQVPDNTIVIFSAHGVSQAVRREAERRGLKVFDATCPLVTKVHIEVARHCRAGRDVILIGHAGHPEVEGTMGQVREGGMLLVEVVEDVANLVVDDVEKLAHVSQTTLSVDETFDIIEALKARFPHIKSPNKEDICYATTNRQEAVKKLAADCDIVIVVGSPNSSNSNRLREVAALLGVDAYMVDNASFLQEEWFAGKNHVGVTAGASAPELLVQEVIAQIQAWGHGTIEELKGVEESIVFVLPKELR